MYIFAQIFIAKILRKHTHTHTHIHIRKCTLAHMSNYATTQMCTPCTCILAHILD